MICSFTPERSPRWVPGVAAWLALTAFDRNYFSCDVKSRHKTGMYEVLSSLTGVSPNVPGWSLTVTVSQINID